MTNIIDTQRILRGESQIEYKPVSPQDKFSVRAATTANIALSGLLTVDGVVLAAGDRVLVKDQTTGSENGIYVAAAGAWSRADDANADTSATTQKVTATMHVFVEEGTVNADSGHPGRARRRASRATLA